jgi:hypothetical protein
VGAAGGAIPSPSPRAPVATAGSNEFTLAASSLTASGLVYTGTATVRSGSASVQVLTFTATGASLADFHLTGPCAGGQRMDTTMGAGSQTTISGAITLAVSSLNASLGGVAVSFSASQPPRCRSPAR